MPPDRAKADAYLVQIKRGPKVSADSCTMDIREHADAMMANEPAGLAGIAFTFGIWKGRPECLPGGPGPHLDLTCRLSSDQSFLENSALERAAKAGSPAATNAVADNYYFGRVTRKDPVLAYLHCSVLTIVGNGNQRHDANDHLKTLEQTMTPADLSEARAMFRKWRGMLTSGIQDLMLPK